MVIEKPVQSPQRTMIDRGKRRLMEYRVVCWGFKGRYDENDVEVEQIRGAMRGNLLRTKEMAALQVTRRQRRWSAIRGRILSLFSNVLV